MGLAVPKPVRVKSKRYLAWVRLRRCCIGYECDGAVQAAHVLSVGAGGHDTYTVPLCAKHHTGQLHQWGRQSFEDAHSIDLWRIVRELNAEYIGELEAAI